MNRPYRVLIFGASYGSLLGTKLAAAGHHATLVCLSATAELINREGTRVRFPVKGQGPVDKLVQGIAAHRGMRNAEVDEIVALVDERLAANRRAAA